jgi:hypothetical protein
VYLPSITGEREADLGVGNDFAHSNRAAPVLPPHSRAFGKTYGEWSAQWWQWAYALPADANHPLIDDGEVNCALGQQGKVWFLGGTYTLGPDLENPVPGGVAVVGVADRRCTVEVGKALFFPVLNASADNFLEEEPRSEEALRAEANLLMDFVNPEDLSVTIDGVAIDNLQDYRTDSPLFTYAPLPFPNLPGLAQGGGTSDAVADGYYLLLPPLSAGEHEIEFAGKVVLTDSEGNPVFSFRLDIHYALTVRR